MAMRYCSLVGIEGGEGDTHACPDSKYNIDRAWERGEERRREEKRGEERMRENERE